MAKHTPGPWAVSKNSSSRRVTSTKGIVICNAVLRNTGSAKGGLRHGAKDLLEAEANARLIAEAPELLRIITAIGKWVDNAGRWPNTAAENIADIYRLYGAPAIARATQGDA